MHFISLHDYRDGQWYQNHCDRFKSVHGDVIDHGVDLQLGVDQADHGQVQRVEGFRSVQRDHSGIPHGLQENVWAHRIAHLITHTQGQWLGIASEILAPFIKVSK